MDNSDPESDSELDNSQQIDGMNSDTRFPQTNEILRPVESSISTNVFMSMPNGVTVWLNITVEQLSITDIVLIVQMYGKNIVSNN